MQTLDVLAVIHEESRWTVTASQLDSTFSGSGRMITDTDRGSFVYLIEAGDHYSYLHFDQKDWGSLSLIAGAPAPVFLTDGTHTIELVQFSDELIALLHSIEGNDNYGNQFVEQTEKTFHQFYQAAE
ncbi:hypothetical protein MKY84_10755 [Chryseomicrobium sp. FSL W7-1435]|uniref:UPF0738 family protein n=1 Tax=Chryseomicrobium sp. FSL W7-1435 TaxID=2921704 RepID=UPI003159EAB2